MTACWEAIPEHFATAELDAFVVMPNHLHGIVVLEAEETACREDTACRVPTGGGETSGMVPAAAPPIERFGAPVAGSIPTIVRSFKAAVTKAVNDEQGRDTACRTFLINRFGPLPPGRIPTVWQSKYYEHVVRSERALDHLRGYIAANPSRWAEDSLHPDHTVGPNFG